MPPKSGQKLVRDPATGRFIKGNSSGGRRPIPQDLVDMLSEVTPDACRLLARVIRDQGEETKYRLKAAELVLDRVYGRPRQAVELAGGGDGGPVGLIILPDAGDGER